MEENPRKKQKIGLGTDRAEEFPEKEEEGSQDKSKSTKTPGKFSLDVSPEEDEKLLDDSGIDLNFSKEAGAEKSFEIRRISASAAPGEREGQSPKQEAEGKNSYCRGEMPETNEGERMSEDRYARNGLSGDVAVKKTPDKSLFKKVQEKLMYECSLTPKKVKKKCLGLKMDL